MGGLGKGLLVSGAVLALLAPSAHGAVTRAEYAAQVNPICVASAAQIKAASKGYTKKLKAQLRRGS